MAEAETLTVVCPPLDYGPIVAWFEFNRVPDGFAPEKYRRGWLGKMVPVREHF